MNRFLQPKAARFDQLPSTLGAGLVPQAKCLFARVDRRADILATPPRPQTPDFVQHFDRTAGVDFAQKMNPSFRQRQAPRRDQSAQIATQQPHTRAASHLRGGLARERRWLVVLHIPSPEQSTLLFDLLAGAELVARPKAADPQRVKAFDLIVALGFVVRGEQWLDPTEQAQAHDLTKHMPMGVPATERAFVVELVQMWQSQSGPTLQQMQATCAAGLVEVLGQADRVRVVVDGMKVLDLRSAT